MKNYLQFYIDGQWIDSVHACDFTVENPSTEQLIGVISLGSSDDVDIAVADARRAFGSYAQTSREARIALLEQLLAYT